MHIGYHLSISKGLSAAVDEAVSAGADTFAFFLRNPRGGSAKEFNEKDICDFQSKLEKYHFAKLVAHAPYTLNACGSEQRVRDFAGIAMKEDLQKMDTLNCGYYNFHPGSHVGQGVEEGIRLIASLLNHIITEDTKTLVLLETMSGKGSEVGSNFEEIAEIIRRTTQSEKIGVCLDTCHIYSAGYDFVNAPEQILQEFDQIIGLKKLKAIHLNDSMTPFNSHKDRHECIGKGSIGYEALKRFVSLPELKNIPLILETPNDLPGYAEEIKAMRK